MKTKHASYSLCKKKLKSGGEIWHARFWNPATRRYDRSRSTGVIVEGKKGRRQEADDAARAMLAEFNPPPPSGKSFLDFLAEFWNANPPYFKEKELTEGRKPSAKHINNNISNLRKHIMPYRGFQGISVGAVKSATLRDWMLYLANKGASPALIYACSQTISTSLSYLVERDELEYNPMRKVKPPRVARNEKGNLTQTEEDTPHGNADSEQIEKHPAMADVISAIARINEILELVRQKVEEDSTSGEKYYKELYGILNRQTEHIAAVEVTRKEIGGLLEEIRGDIKIGFAEIKAELKTIKTECDVHQV
jgi:hypothetical protein